MARIRGIKPEIAFDTELALLSERARLFYIMSWCHMDKEGRAEDNPEKLRALIFPYHHEIDANEVLSELHPKFILRYESGGRRFLQVMNWQKHQRPHSTELESAIPPSRKEDLTVKKRFKTFQNISKPPYMEKEKEKEKEYVVGAASPPNHAEVAAYCAERKNGIDPALFIDYYQTRGWKLKGGQTMKDWRAAIRTWEKNGKFGTTQLRDVDPIWKGVGL